MDQNPAGRMPTSAPATGEPETLLLPDLLGDEPRVWWRTRAVRTLVLCAAVAAVPVVTIEVREALEHDRDATTLMLAVFGSLFVAWLGLGGRIFDIGLGALRVLGRSPQIALALAMLALVPIALLASQPAWFSREPRVGARGRYYREWGIRSRRTLPAATGVRRLPAAAHVITGRLRLLGPAASDPAATARQPFYLSRYDARPGLFARARDVVPPVGLGAAMPSVLVSLMAREQLPDADQPLLLLARPPRAIPEVEALDGTDAVMVHPAVIKPGECQFVCEELLAAGYRPDMIVGPLPDAARLIGLAWAHWRRQP